MISLSVHFSSPAGELHRTPGFFMSSSAVCCLPRRLQSSLYVPLIFVGDENCGEKTAEFFFAASIASLSDAKQVLKAFQFCSISPTVSGVRSPPVAKFVRANTSSGSPPRSTLPSGTYLSGFDGFFRTPIVGNEAAARLA